MKRSLKASVGLLLFLLFTLSCEKREIWLETAEETTVSALRSAFEKEQTAFAARTDKPDYSFRQELHRTVHWDRSHKSEDGRFFVPVTLSLQQEHLRFSNGTSTYPYQTVLMIDPRDEQSQYTLLTFFPDDPAAATFTGVLLFEDYFRGNTQMAHFKDGVSIRFREGDSQVSGLNMSLNASGSTFCYWHYLGTVCVLDLDYGGGAEICSPRYEYLCIGVPPEIPEETYDPDEEGSGGGNSGGGGPGGGSSGGINTNNLTQSEKEKLQEAIDENELRCAAKKLMEIINANGSVNIRIGPEANLAKYLPSSKEIVYNSEFYLVYGEVLTHELFHAYQHQLVYGSNFANYGSGQPGYINIEFEQIVFYDIIRNMHGNSSQVGNMFNQSAISGFDAVVSAYEAWINELTTNGTVYPNLSSISDFDQKYQQHLNDFKLYGDTAYSNSNIIPSLMPNAIKQFYNNTLNCND